MYIYVVMEACLFIATAPWCLLLLFCFF